MPERATVFNTTQIGLEAAGNPGVNVPCNRKLLATSIQGAVKATIQNFTAIGTKFPAIAALGKEWVEASIEGIGAYNDLTYLLASLMQTPTPAQQGATTAYLSTFTVANAAPDTISTFSVEQGSSVRAHEFSYGIVTDLTMEFSRDEITLSGSMLGNGFADGAAMTAGPTEIALQPILPTEVSIYLADTFAGLPGSALTRALKASWTLGSRYNPLWTLNAAAGAWVAHVETAPEMAMTLKVEADAAGMALLTQMRSGAKKFMRIEAVSAALAGVGFPYKLTIDMAGFVGEPSEFSDEDGVYAIEWTLTGAYDTTWTKAVEVKLYNKVSAL